jgi:hypothetical protein
VSTKQMSTGPLMRRGEMLMQDKGWWAGLFKGAVEMMGILLETWRILSGAILLRVGGSAEQIAAGLMFGSVVVGKTRGETVWAVLGLAGCCGGTWFLRSSITGQTNHGELILEGHVWEQH